MGRSNPTVYPAAKIHLTETPPPAPASPAPSSSVAKLLPDRAISAPPVIPTGITYRTNSEGARGPEWTLKKTGRGLPGLRAGGPLPQFGVNNPDEATRPALLEKKLLAKEIARFLGKAVKGF